ncbi:protein kinase domain-containing protein [Streptomyces phaeochromogenes]|uniref:protein kinase domain-containing protein n=1 Tax=Streptomyces phaeochromogenes TaxID=1923 RepID=UPI002E117BD7|nr:protein kinase [Streptomyces phaeochromogenes]WSJ05488.1 protein kinase [Streptomyces phaeochromogenes]
MNASGDMVDGRFELLARLGSGGMGTVWRARDSVLHREVALKAVRHDAAASASVRERVLREARALARISHPNVVMIHHIIDDDPHPWLVMELVDGVSLQERLADGPLTPSEAARLGRQVLAALRAAVAAGIQHRDVKPANILLRADGSAVLTDFGIAALQGSTALTATGELIGSPEYIAPERIRGNDDDPASDLWSLGLVLYVCVEGISPLRRGTTLGTLAAVLDEAVPPPVRSGPLSPVLQALLVRDPAARPDAARLDAMLAQVESGTTPDWALPTATAPLPPGPTTAPTHVLPAPPASGGTIPGGPASGPGSTVSGGPGPGSTVPGAPVPAEPVGEHPTRVQNVQNVPPRGLRRRPALIATVAVVVAALATATTALVLNLRESDGDDSKAKGSGVSASGTATSPSAKQSPKPESTPAPSKEASQPAASPSKEATTPSASEGRWIAQLFSEPVGSGTATRDQRLAAVRKTVPEAVYVRSDDYASLRPGFWVIYAPGPFTDGRAALSFCADRGRTTSTTCVGRYLSTESADYSLQCAPPATSPKGRCTRQ